MGWVEAGREGFSTVSRTSCSVVGLVSVGHVFLAVFKDRRKC